jgi:signal peptidase II
LIFDSLKMPTTEIPSSDSQPPVSPSKIENPKSRIQRISDYGTLLLLAVAIFLADRVTKFWIVHHLRFGAHSSTSGAITVIPGFFYIAHVGNPGAAWSMFMGQSVLLGWVAVATLVAIFVWRRALGLHQRIPQVAFGLLCGGIAGNLLDRLRLGYVVDFIDLHFGSYVYPTFNIADSGICVGVILYILYSLKGPRDAGQVASSK